MLVTQACSSFCNAMEYSLPGSSVHGILQARILDWVHTPFSKGCLGSRDQTWVSCIAGRFFTVSAMVTCIYQDKLGYSVAITTKPPDILVASSIMASPFMSRLSVEGRTCSTSSFKVSGTSILGIYSTWSLAVFPVSWHMRKTEGIASTPAAPATVSFSTFFTFYMVDCIIIQKHSLPYPGMLHPLAFLLRKLFSLLNSSMVIDLIRLIKVSSSDKTG